MWAMGGYVSTPHTALVRLVCTRVRLRCLCLQLKMIGAYDSPIEYPNIINVGDQRGFRLPLISFFPSSLDLHVSTMYSH